MKKNIYGFSEYYFLNGQRLETIFNAIGVDGDHPSLWVYNLVKHIKDFSTLNNDEELEGECDKILEKIKSINKKN